MIKGRFFRKQLDCCAAVRWATICMGAGVILPATAMDFDTGIDGLSARFDNTVRYNLAERVEGVDNRIGNSLSANQSDYKFRKAGDVVTNRLDLLSELELDWKEKVGMRLSGAGWYDNAYDDQTVEKNPALPGPTSYDNNRYSSYTDRYYHGPSGELLDAFAYTNFTIDDRPVNIKAGRHVVYWGNSLFSQGGISYSQSPIDGAKAAATPGTETRETFLPLTQISSTAQVTDNISLGAQYYLDWDSIRIPEGGTYLGSADFLLNGPDSFGGPTPLSGFKIENSLGPKHKSGNWGVDAKFTLPELNASTIGVYYREFDEKNGFWVTLDPENSAVRAVFPRDTKLIGLSLDTTVGPFAIGAEISTRRNAGLNSVGLATTDEGARGNTWHGLVNTIYGLTKSPLWDTGTLVGEVTYDYLEKVTENEQLFNGEHSANCPLGRDDGCATRNAWGFNVSFTPQYLQVLPGVDLSVPFTVGGGISGNTADFGGTNEGAYTYSAGFSADIYSRVTTSLVWADSTAQIHNSGTAAGYYGNGNWQTTDRGRVTLTVKTSF